MKLNKSLKHEVEYRKWVAFYRQNPHRLVKDYFGVKLHKFQEFLFVLMHKYPIFAFVACRGISKSFTVALYLFTMCVLYPGTKMVLTSGTKGQAKKIITDKIEKEFVNAHPQTMGVEVKKIKGGQEPEVLFKNGSWIIGLPPTDNSRGIRSMYNVYDESRMINKDVVDDVFEPMHISAIRPLDLYSKTIDGYVEDPERKSIYMTSGRYKSNWNWKRFDGFYKKMLQDIQSGIDPSAIVVSMPYHVGIMYGLITRKEIQKIKRDASYDPIAFLMEYEGEFFGESGLAFFKFDMFSKNRESIKPFYLSYNMEVSIDSDDTFGKFLKLMEKKMPKEEGEIRLMSIDVAPSIGEDSDNNIVAIGRLIPRNGYYERKVVNIKLLKNDVSSVHAKYIKRWFYGFGADEVAIDVHGSSFSLFEELVKPTHDNEMGEEYPAWRVIAGNATDSKIEEYKLRTKDANADDVIYAINPDAEFNHIIANKLRAALEEGDRMVLLPDKEVASNEIREKYKDGLDPMKEAELLEPYIGTDATVNECVLLESERKDNGLVKISAAGNAKKDRYVTLAYLNFLASLWDSSIEEEDDSEACAFFN